MKTNFFSYSSRLVEPGIGELTKKLLARLGLWLVARFQIRPSDINKQQLHDLENISVGEPKVEEGSSMAPPTVDIFHDTLMSGWFNSSTDELFKGFAINKDDIVLDVGCGDSPFLQFCAERGADIMFADINEANVAKTAARLQHSNARSITPMVSDANPLPLADGVANKIIAMEVVEHVDDPVAFLSELARVGRPGALYLITAPDPVAESLQKKGLAPDLYFQKPNHVRIIEREEFSAMVEAAGLIIEKKEYYGFYWSLWWVFFWACKQDLGATPPHPLLASWTTTWQHLLSVEDGAKIKRVLDDFMPKSQAIIARKP